MDTNELLKELISEQKKGNEERIKIGKQIAFFYWLTIISIALSGALYIGTLTSR